MSYGFGFVSVIVDNYLSPLNMLLENEFIHLPSTSRCMILNGRVIMVSGRQTLQRFTGGNPGLGSEDALRKEWFDAEF